LTYSVHAASTVLARGDTLWSRRIQSSTKSMLPLFDL
jgi:hypothetical protein